MLQVQGQMHICNANKCYFIGYIDDHHDLYVEEIGRDNKFWEHMEKKLTIFYEQCILPELVLQRINKGWLCRDPPFILEAQNAENSKKRKRQSYQDVVSYSVAGVNP